MKEEEGGKDQGRDRGRKKGWEEGAETERDLFILVAGAARKYLLMTADATGNFHTKKNEELRTATAAL